VLDGAHNPAGARALAASLAEWFGDAPLTLIFGAFRDKDVSGMLAPLAARARRVILTASSNPRAAAPEALREHVPPGPASVEAAASVAEALALAARPPRTPILCVAGSLSLVGDVLRHAQGGDKPCPIEKPADSMGSLF
jgi:dihydrofolate synthase/folylpolyglutamate synthase